MNSLSRITAYKDNYDKANQLQGISWVKELKKIKNNPYLPYLYF